MRFDFAQSRDVEAEAVEAVNFLWKRKHFDERGWKRKQTRKRKCCKEARSGSNFFKFRRLRIFKLATTVGVKCNNNNIKSTTRTWYGMEWKMKWNGTEISLWNVENARMECNGRFQGRQSSILPFQFHTRFRA